MNTTIPESLSTQFSPTVSWFSNAMENLPDKDIPAAEFVEAIRKGVYKEKIKAVRARFNRALVPTCID